MPGKEQVFGRASVVGVNGSICEPSSDSLSRGGDITSFEDCCDGVEIMIVRICMY